MKKRMTLLLLVASFLTASVLSSCSGTDDTTDTETTPTAIVETETETEPPLTDALPERDFGGAAYTILMTAKVAPYMKFAVAELTGDSVNDIAYERQINIEERFNAKIEVIPDIEHGTEFSRLQNFLTAGETFVDLIQPNGNGYGKAGSLIAEGLLMDWNTLEYVDFTKPWWNSTAIESTSSKNGVYAAYGSLTVLRSGIFALLFNKPMMENYQIEFPYDLVEAGEWTHDALLPMVEQGALDINGDSIMDESDQYGLVANQTTMGNFQYLYGAEVAKFNGDGQIELVYSAEKLQNITEKILALSAKDITYIYSGSDNDSPRILFANNQALFYYAPFGMYYQDYRDIDFDYGIVPLPKYDESQENYITGKAVSLFISASTEDPERTGIITEAMAAYTYLHVQDVFVQDMMEGKLARDERSADMIDIILNNTIIEIMDVILPENTLLGTVRNSVTSGKLNVQSFIATNLNKTQAAIDKLNEALAGS